MEKEEQMEKADILIDEIQKIYYRFSVCTWQNKYWLGVAVHNEP